MMSPLTIICCLFKIVTDMEGLIQCPGCGDRHRHVGHGCYQRYHPDDCNQLKVPRFRCHNPDCPRVTFSILPYPCLRYKRNTLAFYSVLLWLLERYCIHELAQLHNKGWTAMRRLIRTARQVWERFQTERDRQCWGPCPCQDPERNWTSFTQALSQVALPGPG